MTRLLTLLFTLIILCSTGQTPPKSSKVKEEKSITSSQPSAQNMVNTVISDTCIGKKFSVVFYLIQDSLNSLPTNTLMLNSYSLSTVMTVLNNAFERICVSFEHCKTVIIPYYPYNKWKPNVADVFILGTWFHENTINIYLPDEFLPVWPDVPEVGYSFPPATGTNVNVNAIVCEKAAATGTQAVNFKGSTLLHAFGHYFGLPHTYAEIDPSNPPQFPPTPPISTLEYADRSNIQNCYDHGDGFCDTDADPYPYASTLKQSELNCATTGLKDGQGIWFTPPFDNIMSHYACRCRFSNEQYQHMARFIMKHRMDLH